MYFFRLLFYNRNTNTYHHEPFGGAMTLDEAVHRCQVRAERDLVFDEVPLTDAEVVTGYQGKWETADRAFQIVLSPY